jgi:hypothetical protein
MIPKDYCTYFVEDAVSYEFSEEEEETWFE